MDRRSGLSRMSWGGSLKEKKTDGGTEMEEADGVAENVRVVADVGATGLIRLRPCRRLVDADIGEIGMSGHVLLPCIGAEDARL